MYTKIIYIHLLDEGIDVIRPAHAKELPDGSYEILTPPEYDPEYEIWEFTPGSTVRCRAEIFQGEEYLVAYEECTKY